MFKSFFTHNEIELREIKFSAFAETHFDQLSQFHCKYRSRLAAKPKTSSFAKFGNVGQDTSNFHTNWLNEIRNHFEFHHRFF
jgi:hypothetical protein